MDFVLLVGLLMGLAVLFGAMVGLSSDNSKATTGVDDDDDGRCVGVGRHSVSGRSLCDPIDGNMSGIFE